MVAREPRASQESRDHGVEDGSLPPGPPLATATGRVAYRHRHGHLEPFALADDVRAFGIPFVHIPVDSSDKTAAERAQLELLRGNVDLVVLARYMQIISENFLEQVGAPVINIHHSFLPAFIGAGPYQKAKIGE